MRWDAPWAFALLLLVPLALWRRRRGGPPPAVLWVRSQEWGGRLGARLVRGLVVLPWIAVVLAIAAIARPQEGLRLSEIETRGVDIVLAIDISPSMMAEDGTAIGMALATSVARLRDSRAPSRVIVLLTDGDNNRGAIDPLTGADLARTYGVKVYSVLVGRGGVVPVPVNDPVLGRRVEMVQMDVDEGTLREIARRTGGRFFRATDAAALAGIYAEIDHLERAPIRSVEYREYRDLGPLLLAAAAIVLGLYTLSSATWAFRLP